MIAIDDLELGADQDVEQARRGLGIDAGHPADDQFALEQVLDGLVRRRVPRCRDADLAADAADPAELGARSGPGMGSSS